MDSQKLNFADLRAWSGPILLTATIFILSSTSRIATPDLGFQFPKDKLAHFLVFGLLTTSIIRIPYFRKLGLKGAILAAAITILYGALDEWRQSFTLGRSVELADWIADTLGAIVAATTYRTCHPYRKMLEWRMFTKKK